MGDSETVAAETSAAETYPSTGYEDTASNPVTEAGVTPAEFAGEATAQVNSSHGVTYSGEGNAYAGDPNSVLQQAQFNANNDSKQAAGVPDTNEATPMDADNNSSVNGAVGSAAGLVNGNAGLDGSADEKQLTDNYGIYMLFFLAIVHLGIMSRFTFPSELFFNCLRKTLNSVSRLGMKFVSNIIKSRDLGFKWFIK